MIKNLENQAADAYSKILTRYPVMPAAPEARKQLEALKRPIPKATPAAIAQNKKEEESRAQLGMVGRFMDNLKRGPNTSVAEATLVGDPTMIDPKPTNAPDLIREAGNVGAHKTQGKDTLAVESVKGGAPPPNQPIPRSDAPPPAATDNTNNTGISDLQPIADPSSGGAAPATGSSAPPAGAAPASGGSNVAVPAVPSNGAQPTPQQAQSSPVDSTAASDAAATPPAQVNEAAQPSTGESSSNANAATANNEQAQNQDVSTSKAKKKKGLHKLVPF